LNGLLQLPLPLLLPPLPKLLVLPLLLLLVRVTAAS
jgi:hypothetical protein